MPQVVARLRNNTKAVLNIASLIFGELQNRSILLYHILHKEYCRI